MPQSQYDGAPGGIYDNYDEVQLHPPAGAVRADIRLMYQPTSWEYIQFIDQARITSYNVCYTKLLRRRHSRPWRT